MEVFYRYCRILLEIFEMKYYSNNLYFWEREREITLSFIWTLIMGWVNCLWNLNYTLIARHILLSTQLRYLQYLIVQRCLFVSLIKRYVQHCQLNQYTYAKVSKHVHYPTFHYYFPPVMKDIQMEPNFLEYLMFIYSVEISKYCSSLFLTC